MDITPLSRVFPDFFEVGIFNPVFIAHTKNCLPLTSDHEFGDKGVYCQTPIQLRYKTRI